jgi:hypothetical protein
MEAAISDNNRAAIVKNRPLPPSANCGPGRMVPLKEAGNQKVLNASPPPRFQRARSDRRRIEKECLHGKRETPSDAASHHRIGQIKKRELIPFTRQTAI